MTTDGDLTGPAGEKKNRPGLWGWGMAALYTGFALFILVLVGYASLQDYQLVEDDYYEKGIAYQDQIDKRTNAATLAKDVNWSFDSSNRNLTVSFPEEFDREDISGTISLFRPSNAHLDQKLAVALDEANRQVIDGSKMARGKWKLKIDWTAGGRAFYFEDMLVIE